MSLRHEVTPEVAAKVVEISKALLAELPRLREWCDRMEANCNNDLATPDVVSTAKAREIQWLYQEWHRIAVDSPVADFYLGMANFARQLAAIEAAGLTLDQATKVLEADLGYPLFKTTPSPADQFRHMMGGEEAP